MSDSVQPVVGMKYLVNTEGGGSFEATCVFVESGPLGATVARFRPESADIRRYLGQAEHLVGRAHWPYALSELPSENGLLPAADVVDVGRPQHLTTDSVTLEVRARYGREEISDAAAVTIASWFQSPAGHGAVFAALSTTGRVSVRELIDAIYAERAGALPPLPQPVDRALDMLATWVLRHPSRHEITDDPEPTGAGESITPKENA